MKLNLDIVKKLLVAVKATSDDELSCGECYEQIEKFTEIALAGKSPEEAMPLVENHLNRCNDCREEYEALLEALKKLEDSEKNII